MVFACRVKVRVISGQNRSSRGAKERVGFSRVAKTSKLSPTILSFCDPREGIPGSFACREGLCLAKIVVLTLETGF